MRRLASMLLILFFSLSGQQVRRAPLPRDGVLVPPAMPPGHIADRKREFLKAYDKLIAALNDFSEAYYQQSGHVMPIDKVNAVKKAWKDLQRTEPAFK